ncbi:MAG: 50S ribosomal protein L31 [Firmicutes bacterium]|nr:50S ribosomal protein L31 [Bacillota bacterium]
MKAGIHPQLYDATVTCACGAVYRIRSTKPQIRLEICGRCHPFYTGTQRVVDTGGRVERFRKRFGTDYRRSGRGAEASGDAAEAQAGAAETEAGR